MRSIYKFTEIKEKKLTYCFKTIHTKKYIYRKLFKHCYKFWKIKYKFFNLCTFGEKR